MELLISISILLFIIDLILGMMILKSLDNERNIHIIIEKIENDIKE